MVIPRHSATAHAAVACRAVVQLIPPPPSVRGNLQRSDAGCDATDPRTGNDRGPVGWRVGQRISPRTGSVTQNVRVPPSGSGTITCRLQLVGFDDDRDAP